MGHFDKELRFLDELPTLVNESIKEAFRQYGFVVLDYITNKQLFQKGEDAQGEKIQSKYLEKGIAYSSFTVKMKRQSGDPYDRVTWRDKGNLYKNMRLSIGDKEVSLIITVDYFGKLEARYGDDVLGVQRQYLEEFTENYIIPTIKKNINDRITKL